MNIAFSPSSLLCVKKAKKTPKNCQVTVKERERRIENNTAKKAAGKTNSEVQADQRSRLWLRNSNCLLGQRGIERERHAATANLTRPAKCVCHVGLFTMLFREVAVTDFSSSLHFSVTIALPWKPKMAREPPHTSFRDTERACRALGLTLVT